MTHSLFGRAAATRRTLFTGAAVAVALLTAGADDPATQAARTTVIEFEESLARQRLAHYRHRQVDIVETGFRPVGGTVADFAVAEHRGRYHFFYIERRLAEGTPFYPGHEIFFGHASTGDFTHWEVHDPVMLVRPGTWEGAHVWAPSIVRHDDVFLMAYTGVNEHLSQDIGFAFSTDLFDWTRRAGNPISPCRGRPWAFWRVDGIASCRDPHILPHDGRYWMIYSATTREGASCIALASTADFTAWQDHGAICIGPASGYEPRLEGGHPQGCLESAALFNHRGAWLLTVKAKLRDDDRCSWIIHSDRVDQFDFSRRREFWPGAAGIEIVSTRGNMSLLATFQAGVIKFGLVNWDQPEPTARFVTSLAELEPWRPSPVPGPDTPPAPQ